MILLSRPDFVWLIASESLIRLFWILKNLQIWRKMFQIWYWFDVKTAYLHTEGAIQQYVWAGIEYDGPFSVDDIIANQPVVHFLRIILFFHVLIDSMSKIRSLFWHLTKKQRSASGGLVRFAHTLTRDDHLDPSTRWCKIFSSQKYFLQNDWFKQRFNEMSSRNML